MKKAFDSNVARFKPRLRAATPGGIASDEATTAEPATAPPDEGAQASPRTGAKLFLSGKLNTPGLPTLPPTN